MNPMEPDRVTHPYALATSERFTEDGAPYIACGISNHSGEVLLEDVSSNATLVSKAVDLFNLCGLPPERLKQTILDLIP